MLFMEYILQVYLYIQLASVGCTTTTSYIYMSSSRDFVYMCLVYCIESTKIMINDVYVCTKRFN